MLSETQLNILDKKLDSLKNELITKKERIKQKESLEQSLTENKILLKKIELEETHFKQSRLFLVKSQNEKRKKDFEAIEKSMLFASQLVEQKKELIPRFRTSNDKYPVSDIVVDQGTKPSKLSNIEGMGVAESISIMTTIAVLLATPYNKVLWLDEYFSSISPTNTQNMSGKLEKLTEGRIQALLIEQKDEIVSNAKYREFYIEYDGKTSKVLTYDVDEEGNKILVE